MDIERKLASVRRIAAINPIEGADNIVCATVDGWELVTQKSNNFQPGDLVVYFEIDSFLPITEQFEFLRKSSYRVMGNVPGFRLKTIKLRGQVSQGLILPMSEFFHDVDGTWYSSDYTGTYPAFEGQDLTEELQIVKWDPPVSANLAGKARGNFPSWIQKTDQERVQNIFGKLKNKFDQDELWEVTLKLDGSSCTVYCKDGYVGVCSRNMDLIETEGNSYWEAARKSKLIEALEAMGRNIAVQGELMGPGVQGNRENLKEVEIFVFDVYNIDEARLLTPEERYDVLNVLRNLGADFSEAITLPMASLRQFETVADMLVHADRPSLYHPIAEGVVFKNFSDGNKSFKVINNKFLLKEKD